MPWDVQAAALSKGLTDMGLSITGIFSRLDQTDARFYDLVRGSL